MVGCRRSCLFSRLWHSRGSRSVFSLAIAVHAQTFAFRFVRGFVFFSATNQWRGQDEGDTRRLANFFVTSVRRARSVVGTTSS